MKLQVLSRYIYEHFEAIVQMMNIQNICSNFCHVQIVIHSQLLTLFLHGTRSLHTHNSLTYVQQQYHMICDKYTYTPVTPVIHKHYSPFFQINPAIYVHKFLEESCNFVTRINNSTIIHTLSLACTNSMANLKKKFFETMPLIHTF